MSKCILSLDNKDARHAHIGMIQGYGGSLSDDTTIRLERIMLDAQRSGIETQCSLEDVHIIYQCMWGYRKAHGVPDYRMMADLP